MVRGRHRGLPVAIDRAVLFPKEYKLSNTNTSPMDIHPTETQTEANVHFADANTQRSPKVPEHDGSDSSSTVSGGESPPTVRVEHQIQPRRSTAFSLSTQLHGSP